MPAPETAEPPEPSTFVVIVDLSARDSAVEPPPRAGCTSFEERSGYCIDWRAKRSVAAKVVYGFGIRPRNLFSSLHLPDLDGRALARGRYLVAYRLVNEGYEGQIVAIAPESAGAWCLPNAAIAANPPAAGQGKHADGSWCVRRGEVARLVRDGQREAVRSSPYSLILGKLLSQRSTGLCDTEYCWNSVTEGRMQVQDNFAGRPVTGSITVQYWAHAYYVGKPVVAGLFAKGDDGRYHSSMRTFIPEREQVCIAESWFFPARNGMAVPREGRRTPDGDVCFRL